MNSDVEPMYVDCGVHGERVAAVVCCHLVRESGSKAGFIENSTDPNDLQAWCYECEAKFDTEGEMADSFKEFCDIKIVCVNCYQSFKSYHYKTN